MAPARGGTTASLSGLVHNLRGVPLDRVEVSSASDAAMTGTDGRFLVEAELLETLTLQRPAYAGTEASWVGSGPGRLVVTMSPRISRALHVSGPTAADPEAWQSMLDIAASTSINAMMIDVKTESGFVFAENAVAAVAAAGANAPDQYDLSERTADAHAQGLAVIVRVVSFQDPLAAQANPSWAAWDQATGAPYQKAGQWFLDPYDPDARRYALDLAVEACAQGVDEVQFDYMRFPAGDPDTVVYDGPNTPEGRQETIAGFMEEAGAVLHPMGCATAIDIFGFITNKTHEGGIGQQLELLAAVTDVISPMTYPSLYSENWYGFSDPSQHPGPVVRNANQDALDRLGDGVAVLRPWLQDFWYTEAQVRVQLEEADGLGLGWMLWNVNSDFTTAAILTDAEVTAHEGAPEPFFEPLPSTGFYDVPDGHVFATGVTWARDTEVTLGCNPPWGDEFCPTDIVTREQMAAFLRRALDLEPPDGTDTFTDDDGSLFEPDIEAIAAAGITLGCTADRFCPTEPVTRAQVASFLARALDLALIDDPDRFEDDDGSPHETAIAALAEAGITLGCTADPPRFCPADGLTRGQMAALLFRALAPA